MSPATSNVTIGPGILSLPGTTFASKQAAEKCLSDDNKTHHCYFRTSGLHNHLSHHILAAYDLGASAQLLEAIYKDEAQLQRPILLDQDSETLKAGDITSENWKKYLGNQKAYAAYVSYFTEQVLDLGAPRFVEKYIFSSDSNDDGVHMLVRLVAGALHPFIQLGYAAEFGSDPNLVAEAVAQAAIHNDEPATYDCFKYIPPTTASNGPGTLFDVLKEFYTSDILKPVLPYNPDLLYNARRNAAFAPPSKRASELARVCSLWKFSDSPTPEEMAHKAAEAVWAATLLFASTGRPGKKPRLDFFLMHGLTSSLFLPSYLKLVPNPQNQIRLFRHWFVTLAIVAISRGRPRVNGDLIMQYTDLPLPPSLANVIPNPSADAIGSGFDSFNPWNFITQSALRAPDSHTTKSIRTLLYGARTFGGTGLGQIPGALDANGDEVLPGLKGVDGTIFIRAAGIVMNTLGWVDWGQKAGEWDRSSLGWDDAWKNEPEDVKLKETNGEKRVSYM